MYVWRIKSQANEDARQEFLDGYVSQIRELGLEIPDPSLRKDGNRPLAYTEPDWEKLAVVTGHGPARGAARVQTAVATGRGVGRAGRPRGGGMNTGAWARARHPHRKPMIYEVFRQERKGQPLQHAGTVTAPNERFAEIYAREQHGRRQESVALWLVPRDAVSEIDEFLDEFDLKYRAWTATRSRRGCGRRARRARSSSRPKVIDEQANRPAVDRRRRADPGWRNSR